MASVVDICNIALSHIGAEAQIAAIDPPDGSYEAGLCARFYPLARLELLENPSWSFANRRTALAEVTNESDTWLYAYALPSGMIKALRVLSLAYAREAALLWPTDLNSHSWPVVDDVFTERGSSRFEIEGQVLYTNEPEATLKYVADITDTTRFSPMFVSALGMLLASYLAGPIVKGPEGATIGARWREAAGAMARSAATSNANSSSERAEHVAEQIRARA